MLVAVCAIAGAVLLLRDGWIGGFGQVIGHDYMVFYSTVTLYRTDPDRLYDYQAHRDTTDALVAPTRLEAVNPNSNPPFAAMAFALLTFLPLPASFAAWSLLSIGFVVLAIRVAHPLVPRPLVAAGVTRTELTIVALSFYPFVEGWPPGTG